MPSIYLDAEGVLRLRRHMHYGMVSPFRLAREAAERAYEGAAKWLDELLVRRELAYTFCFHRPNHATIDAIPAWARDTLRQHEGDPRTFYSWEQLVCGKTSDLFWNAMQHSLLAHGALHNNVRMTWGKAFAGWTTNATRALSLECRRDRRRIVWPDVCAHVGRSQHRCQCVREVTRLGRTLRYETRRPVAI